MIPRFLLALLATAATAHAANFPYIRLNGQAAQISDNGTAITRGGVPIGGGGNMTNSGAASVGAIARATDTTGTQWSPTTLQVTNGATILFPTNLTGGVVMKVPSQSGIATNLGFYIVKPQPFSTRIRHLMKPCGGDIT